MEFWRELLSSFAWPAWILVLLPAPIGFAAAFRIAFRKGIEWYERPNKYMVFAAWRAGVGVVLPVLLIGGWLSDAMSLERGAVAGVLGGSAVGMFGLIALLVSASLGDLWKRYEKHHGAHGTPTFFFRWELQSRWSEFNKWLHK